MSFCFTTHLPSNLISRHALFTLLPPKKCIGNLRAFAYTMPPACNAFLPPLCLHKCPPIPQAPLKPNLSSEILLDFPNPQSACPPVSCFHASIPCLLLSIWPALPFFDIYLSLFSVFIFYDVPYLMLSFDYKLEERGVSSDFLYTQFLEQDLEHRYNHAIRLTCFIRL